MVTSPTGKGVIVMGGTEPNSRDSKAIFELSASMQWTRMEQTLENDMFMPLAIPIPDELLWEKIKPENKRRKLKHK